MSVKYDDKTNLIIYRHEKRNLQEIRVCDFDVTIGKEFVENELVYSITIPKYGQAVHLGHDTAEEVVQALQLLINDKELEKSDCVMIDFKNHTCQQRKIQKKRSSV